MKHDPNLINEARRAAYLDQRKVSDKIRTKGVHFYNEQRGDTTSPLGRIRKYTRGKTDSVMGGLLGNSSGLALLVADSIETSSQKAIYILKAAMSRLQQSPSAPPNTHIDNLSQDFAHQAIIVDDKIYEAIETHIKLEDDVNALKRENLSKGKFIGPLQESFADALSKFEGKDLNDPSVQEALKATINNHTLNITRESGIYKLNGVFVVPASQMASFQESFRHSAAEGKNVVHVYGAQNTTGPSVPTNTLEPVSAPPRPAPVFTN